VEPSSKESVMRIKKFFGFGRWLRLTRRWAVYTAIALVTASVGCIRYQPHPGAPMELAIFVQRGIMLNLTHLCTDKVRVHLAGKYFVGEVVGGEPHNIPLEPSNIGDPMIHVVFQSVDSQGKIRFTNEASFRIDSYRTTARPVIIDEDCRLSYGRY